MRTPIILAASALMLAGCGNGWPWGRGPDPHHDEALANAAPLVKVCEAQLEAKLAPHKPVLIGGPSIVPVDAGTTIELTAQPVDPNAIDDLRFICRFDGTQLLSAGLSR